MRPDMKRRLVPDTHGVREPIGMQLGQTLTTMHLYNGTLQTTSFFSGIILVWTQPQSDGVCFFANSASQTLHLQYPTLRLSSFESQPPSGQPGKFGQ
jgi:hypothetical protein